MGSHKIASLKQVSDPTIQQHTVLTLSRSGPDCSKQTMLVNDM